MPLDDLLEGYRQRYERTRNPIDVVRAYQVYSEHVRADRRADLAGPPMPDWILSYFDDVASTVQELFGDHVDDRPSHCGSRHTVTRRPVADLARTLTAALGFKAAGQGVRTDAFVDWHRDEREWQLALAVWRHQRAHAELSLEASVAEIAERHPDVGDTTVWRAWARYRTTLQS